MTDVANEFMEDTIIYQPFTEEAAKSFDIEQQYLNNLDHQWQDLEESCKVLGITWAGANTPAYPYPRNSRSGNHPPFTRCTRCMETPILEDVFWHLLVVISERLREKAVE